MEQQQSSSGIVFFLVLALILLLSILLVYVYRDTIFPWQVITDTSDPQKTSLILEAKDHEQPIAVNYLLQEQGFPLAQGNLSLDRYELFPEAYENHTYTLTTFSEAYYLNRSDCLWNQTYCTVSMMKVAHPFVAAARTAPKEVTLFLQQEMNTGIRQPVFCMAYTYNLYFVEFTGLEKVEIPQSLKNKVDKCFMVGRDITEEASQWKITFAYQQEPDDQLTLYVLDRGYNQDLLEQYDEGNMPTQNVSVSIKN